MISDKEYQILLNENILQFNLEKWKRWITKYVEPSFDKNRTHEMIKNFGYVSADKFDFKIQSEFFDKLQSENRLDDETKKFIGFLAGAGFFKEYNLSLEEWLNIPHWVNPYLDTHNRKSINELLNFENGLLAFKLDLLEMPFWKR